jgi:hypothetical protein
MDVSQWIIPLPKHIRSYLAEAAETHFQISFYLIIVYLHLLTLMAADKVIHFLFAKRHKQNSSLLFSSAPPAVCVYVSV